MDVVHTLLILSANLVLTRGVSIPRVALFPNFPHLYVSDEVTLRCLRDKTVLTSNVKWYFNDQLQTTVNSNLYIPMVTLENSGKYICEENGVKSLEHKIEVLDMMPFSVLSSRERKVVAIPGYGYLMDLYVETGLEGWSCRFTAEGKEKLLPIIQNKWEDKNRRVTIHTAIKNSEPSSTYWCYNKGTKERSNAITLRRADKNVILQVLDPVFEGETVTLLCEDWERENLAEVKFYKGAVEISNCQKDTCTFKNIDSSYRGSYWCSAKRDPNSPAIESDKHELRITAGPPAARLTAGKSWLACDWPCNGQTKYRWYQVNDNLAKEMLSPESSSIFKPPNKGSFSCRAVCGGRGLSPSSNIIFFTSEPEDNTGLLIGVVLFLFFLLLLAFGIGIFVYRKRKTRSSGKKFKEGEDGGYEAIKLKEGEYEALKGGETQVYQTLKDKEKGQDEQLYEALKEGGDKKEGTYEALKNTQAEVYHTLKDPAEKKDEGAYEALKNTQTEVYHTLKDPAEKKDEGAYEALKNTQTEIYHTLKESSNPE